MTDADLKKAINSKMEVFLDGVGYLYNNGSYRSIEKEDPKDLAEIIFRVILKQEGTVFKGGKRIQCSRGRSRSIVDTYRVARTYIPTITYEDVEKAVRCLYTAGSGHSTSEPQRRECFVANKGAGLIRANYCSYTNRVVHNITSLTKSTEDAVRVELEKLKLNTKCTKQKGQNKG